MGRIKPKTVSDLMDIANRFADGEDACNNKQTQSPEYDRGNRYGGQRRRSHNYDNYGSHSQLPWDTKTTIIKEMTTETQGTAAMEEKTMGAAKGFSQENLKNTIHHQMIC
jgi:hypothetical protein